MFLVVYSVAQEQGIKASWLSHIIFPIILFTTLSSAAASKRQLRLLIGFFLVLLLLDVWKVAAGGHALEILSRVGHLFFLLFVVRVILGHVFRESTVSTDMILGSICAYMMLGLFFNEGFALIETLIPGSFEGLADIRKDGGYFSFVTFSTLGYGDVVPVKAVARSVAAMAAVTGQFYIAIIVARLVAAHVSARRDERETEEAAS